MVKGSSARIAFSTFVLLSGPAIPHALRPLSVADTIETTRLAKVSVAMGTEGVTGEDVAISPDGKRYAVAFLRGDLAGDGLRYEIFSGQLDSLESAQPQLIARLFSRSRFYPEKRRQDSPGNHLTWLADGERVAFYWDDSLDRAQAAAVNVRMRRVEFLTNHSTGIYKFDIGPAGAVLYGTHAKHGRDVTAERRGLVVQNEHFFGFLRDDTDGNGDVWGFERFVANADRRSAPRKVLGGRPVDLFPPFLDATFSPDGKYALITASPTSIPQAWSAYNDPFLKANLQRAKTGTSAEALTQIAQLFVVDVERAKMWPILDAPVANPYRLRIAWSADSSSVTAGPTLLPVGARRTDADAFVKIDVHDGKWQATSQPPQPSARKTAPVRLELRQGMNDPPRLFAVDDRRRRARMVLNLNPHLRSSFQLGLAEPARWSDKEGRQWEGRLYLPVNYRRGHRYPIVIQTHGFVSPNEFSLYGMAGDGLGPGWSIYAAQALANRGMAVLHMQNPPSNLGTSPQEVDGFVAGFEGAVQHLIARGLADPQKIGLSGYSRTGWYVLHALTHSQVPIGAAIVSDNLDASYVTSILTGDHGVLGETALDLGASRFGEGLQTWLRRAPGFNVHEIQTPLRMQRESGGLAAALTSWELFVGLRDLEKPTELFLVPDIEHGNHGLLTPTQALASQGGAVDWFEFWLSSPVASDPSKANQYLRWKRLRSAE